MWPAARVMLCAVDQCGVRPWVHAARLAACSIISCVATCNSYIAWCPLGHRPPHRRRAPILYSWLYKSPKVKVDFDLKRQYLYFFFCFVIAVWSTMVHGTIDRICLCLFLPTKNSISISINMDLALLPLRYTSNGNNPWSSTRVFCWLNMVHMLGQ